MGIKEIIGWLLIPYIKLPQLMYKKWEGNYSKPVRIIGSISLSFILFLVWAVIMGSISRNQNNTSQNVVVINTSSPVPVISSVTTTQNTTNTPIPTATIDPKMEYNEWIKKQFSAWDGSHYELVRLLKENMNDADSFEHIQTRYNDDGDGLTIMMKYRGKNAFGGKIINYVTAKSDYKSNTIKILAND